MHTFASRYQSTSSKYSEAMYHDHEARIRLQQMERAGKGRAPPPDSVTGSSNSSCDGTKSVNQFEKWMMEVEEKEKKLVRFVRSTHSSSGETASAITLPPPVLQPYIY